MAADEPRRFRHFVLRDVTDVERYQRPPRRIESAGIPARDRQQHGGALLGKFGGLREEATRAGEEQRQAGIQVDLGIQVEFESFPDIELAFERLSAEPSGIELLNVRRDGPRTKATVFVPDGKLDKLEGKIQAYMERRTDARGRRRDNQKLVDTIEEIRAATIEALWTDDPTLLPEGDDSPFWWEVWLPVRRDRRAVSDSFRERATARGMRVLDGEVRFPERTILIVQATPQQMKQSLVIINNIAELRAAKETAEFFDALTVEEQREWIEHLLARVEFQEAGGDDPHVCLMDTGVTRAHPLLESALAGPDMHTVEPAWGVGDGDGHGTALAGLAIGGDLSRLLDSEGAIVIDHRLESVKILHRDGGNVGEPAFHAHLTEEAVGRPEVTAPARRRVFAMALTTRDGRDRGRPSAWSAAIDSLASDADNQGQSPRLLVIAAGNVNDARAWREYPTSNETDGVHDPAQAWNAITVGACTDMIRITEEDGDELQPIASAGGLSPFSTTSRTWQQAHWPLKPDVVIEGGNVARDGQGDARTVSSLMLLTTHHRPTQRLLTTTNATSAATALVARMAARIMAAYPDLWPETVRGLITHSADWTDEMRRMHLRASPNKQDYRELVQRCGFGVPDLDRAIWSVDNSLTMVVQTQLQPFVREGRAAPKLRDMHLHRLPWPLDSLEALQDTIVEMRVTLSYFIEPNPSARGVTSRYRYESHGLRFDVRRAEESVDAFRARVNATARAEDDAGGARGSPPADPDWIIGSQARHRGSLHSDTWRGPAAALASRGVLAVYPTLGWWKTRQKLECYNRPVRYALLVSIRAPEVDVDLRTEIANQVATETEVDT